MGDREHSPVGGVRQGARETFGAKAINTVQPQAPFVYLRLRFEDPEGVLRDFPENFPVTVRFSPPGAGVVRDRLCTVSPGGKLVFPAWDAPGDFWRNFLLIFDASPSFPNIVCEPHAALVSPPPPAFTRYSRGLELAANTANRERFFALPPRWLMRQGDWRFGDQRFTGNGEYISPPGLFRHTALRADIGSAARPVEFILNPNWHFLRFEYFDRYHGNSHLDSPPRPALRRRISTPPIRVAGFRADPNAAADQADSFSNWTTGATSPPDGTNLLQCLPFVLRRDANGVAFSPPGGAELGLRFRTPANAAIFAESFSVRRYVFSPPPPAGPDRLKLYDLPRVWKSRNYYTRRILSSPPAPGKFFQTLTAAEITDAKQKAKPLVFSLDDMVLMTGDPAAGTSTALLSPPATRVAIFNHRFDDRLPDANPQGLYKLLSPPGPDELDLPRSDVPAPVNNYLHDYPDWTRLVVTGGNLFDVFDQRTPDHPSPPNVVGARAAVRWVDGTAPFPGISAFEWSNAAGGWVPSATNDPIPGRVLSPPFTARTDVPAVAPLFSLQPHFQQRMPWSQWPFDNSDSQIGRYDLALLRCSDVREGDEVAQSFSYFRQNFHWDSPPPPSPPAAIPLTVSRPAYANLQAQNVANRWSGNEPGASDHRAQILPRIPSPPASPPPFRSPSVWFLQSLPLTQSHFGLQLRAGGRDNRGSQLGSGDSGATSFQTMPVTAPEPSNQLWFTSAHETGHMGGMPDEYNERWNAGSYGHMSFAWNTPGDPYEPDGRDETDRFSRPDSGMMNGNKLMRNRYFWHNAEFIRQVTGEKLRVALGPDYPDYWLPEHAQAATGRTHYCWPVASSVNPAVNAARSFDMYLYALGKDHYSQRLLAGGPPNGPFDGILVIDVKIAFNLSSWANANTRESRRRDMLARVNSSVRQQMNSRWYAAGTLNLGAETVTFRRCLIQCVPQALVFNHPHDPSPPPTDGEQVNANTMLGRFGYDFQVNIDRPTGPAAAAYRVASPAMLDINLNGSNANLDGLFIRRFPQMIFGVDRNLAVAAPNPLAVTPADWVPIVQRLIPGATVHTLP